MSTQTFLLARSGQLPILHAHLERELVKGRPLRVTVTDAPSRSREQLGYLHVAIRELARHTGTAESELRDYFKLEFGPATSITLGTNGRPVPKSMSRYTREEASDMIEHVVRIAAECGLLLEPRGVL